MYMNHLYKVNANKSSYLNLFFLRYVTVFTGAQKRGSFINLSLLARDEIDSIRKINNKWAVWTSYLSATVAESFSFSC